MVVMGALPYGAPMARVADHATPAPDPRERAAVRER
jgi:hypothetical protein